MTGTSRGGAAAVVFCVIATAALAQGAPEYAPARRAAGAVPQPQINAIGWVEAVVDLQIDSTGAISNTVGLRATPGGLDYVLPTLKTWKFRPATDAGVAVASHVLVAVMLRPAQLFDPAGGSPPQDLKAPVSEMVVPLVMPRPAYPVSVVGNQAVLIEVVIRPDARVEKVAVIGPPSGFDGAALTAARGWTFRAPRYKGTAVTGIAYLVFGFRMPV